MPSPEIIFFSLTGGLLPALLWLWFWLKEDRLHPEPRGMIMQTFIAGMIAVPLVLPLQRYIDKVYVLVPLTTFLLAATEESFKWLAAFFAGFETREYDEPIDAVIYMITAALGFAALENVFFLFNSISNISPVQSFINGNLRFVGANLLHVLTSGVIGYFMGLAFGHSWFKKILYFLFGIVLATLLHTTFNLYIMKSNGKSIFVVFSLVWIALVILIAGFEKVKKIKELW